MEYTRLETDYETGEVFRISIGEHLTFTEIAKKLEVTRSILNKAMLEGDLCRREYDEIAKKYRIRLHPEAVEKGLGHRIMGSHGPFDVLSPVGRQVADEMLKTYLLSINLSQWQHVFKALWEFESERVRAGCSPLSAQMRCSWILDHFGQVPVEIISEGIGVSERLVYRHKRIRDAQKEKNKRNLRRVLSVPAL